MPDFRFVKFDDMVCRQTAFGNHPLGAQGSLAYGGRFNPPALFQLLYTSLSPKGVKAEFIKFSKSRGQRPEELLPREAHQLFVTLHKVIDLTDSHNRKLLNCSARDLVGDDWKLTQKIGMRFNGVCDAIISFSAAAPKEKNLILYESGIRHVVILASSVIVEMSEWDKIITEY